MAENTKALRHIHSLSIIKRLCQEVAMGDSVVLLFGSYAKGTQRDESDLDLAVIGRTPYEETLERFSHTYGKEITTHRMTRIPRRGDHLWYEILKNHLVLSGCSAFVAGVLYGEHTMVRAAEEQN